MQYFQALILSTIEGITEFLPISSTVHLILASSILKIPQTEFVKSFEIIIQLGAILAIVVLYWKRLISDISLWQKVLLAFFPTMVLGFSLYKLIKVYLLGNTLVVLWSLFIGGIAFILLEKFYYKKNSQNKKIENLSIKQAFSIGLFQSISMMPGVSRAAATIFGGMFLGLSRKEAVEFSFLLAVPTMFAATVLDLAKSSFSFTFDQWGLLITGFLGSFITAMLAVKFFLQFIQKHTFIGFGFYRIILAIVFRQF